MSILLPFTIAIPAVRQMTNGFIANESGLEIRGLYPIIAAMAMVLGQETSRRC
jgi:hypothetical protein